MCAERRACSEAVRPDEAVHLSSTGKSRKVRCKDLLNPHGAAAGQ